MIDALRPSGELTGIVADREFEGIEWTLGHVSQGEEVQIIEPVKHLPHTGSMKSWQGPDRERRHEDPLRSMPDIIEFRRLDQGRGGLRHELVTAHSGHPIEMILLHDVLLHLRRHITGRPEQPGRPCQIHHERARLERFPDRGVACDHAEEGLVRTYGRDEDSVRGRAVRDTTAWRARWASPRRDRPASLRGRLHGAAHGRC